MDIFASVNSGTVDGVCAVLKSIQSLSPIIPVIVDPDDSKDLISCAEKKL